MHWEEEIIRSPFPLGRLPSSHFDIKAYQIKCPPECGLLGLGFLGLRIFDADRWPVAVSVQSKDLIGSGKALPF